MLNLLPGDVPWTISFIFCWKIEAGEAIIKAKLAIDFNQNIDQMKNSGIFFSKLSYESLLMDTEFRS
jgi:hypothetical protein